MSIENLNELIKNMDVSDIASKFISEMIEREKKAEVYYNTGELDYDLAVLKEWLKSNGRTKFATDGVFYTETEEEIQMSELLIKIINALHSVKQGDFENWTSDFAEVGIIYEGCNLSMVFGQGTLYCMEIVE